MNLNSEDPEDKVRMKRIMFNCRNDMLLNVKMLHDTKYVFST